MFVARLPKTYEIPTIDGGRGYRLLLRDGVLLRVLALDVAVVAGAVALLNGLFPVYARNQVHVSEGAIGALFLVNSLLIVGGQLRVARLVEGRARAAALSLMAALFCICWVLTLAAGVGRGGYLLLLAGIVILSLGECIYRLGEDPARRRPRADGAAGSLPRCGELLLAAWVHRRPGGRSSAARLRAGRAVDRGGVVHPERDLLIVRLRSKLLADGRLGFALKFPGVSKSLNPDPTNWPVATHTTQEITRGAGGLTLARQIDDTGTP